MTETARELWWPHHPSRNRETALAALDSGDTGEVTLEYSDFVAIADLLDDAVKALELVAAQINPGDDSPGDTFVDLTEKQTEQIFAILAKLRSHP